MWSNRDCNLPAKGFSTPPASWKSPHALPVMPMSERKCSNFPSGCRRDLFHVVHKVPAGDSPYVKAKHVQLIDKDPSKAISLFWAAINAGDRVDSALKDMAVVMKQLNRSDEAIEAIKSFRHLCPFESEESLDNVLVELYKRSGRIEEEIEMLHRKLNNIEGGIAFGGKRTKIARSQGKKIQITVEQERSRILGNLAWAYLQHHDYGLAENFYRKALALEPDNNKQCNLAICSMHMNKIPEAKSLLQAVKASCGSKEMDESYAKSYERAFEMLTEIDSKSVLKPTRDDDWRKQSGSKCLSSQEAGLRNDWRKGNYFGSPTLQSSVSSNKMHESPIGLTGKELHHGGVLYTQPKKVPSRFGVGDQSRGRCNGDEIKTPFEKVMVHTIRNLDGEMLHSTAEKSEKSISGNVFSPCERSWSERSWTLAVRGKSTETVEPFLQPRMERQTSYDWEHSNQMSDVNVSGKVESTDDTAGDINQGKNNSLTKLSSHKSWADMVEEDEKRRLLPGEDLSPCFNDWNEEECNNENFDSNMNHQSPTVTISQRLEAIDLKDNSYSSNGTPTRNQSARRSLCFDGKKDSNTKMIMKNRLQVFRDITPSQDSP